MRASTTTWLAVLSATLLPASAWEFTAYDTYTCDAKDDTQYRVLSGEGKSGCLNFGQDMPGANCAKFTEGGWIKGPCDGQEFKPRSILVQPGTICQVYHYEGCNQVPYIVIPEDNPKCELSIYPVKSIECAPA
ncbi:hypothetical protein NM208_g7211 [Fusarium decemcellulare]|uniref:Uncharacterized protein n=1 Tax=Fusarium decemcellulare TaxID=57161 RepID=A0ACC1SAB0_9HYPO|nr:hypothetical protein NM208_g7211 [Fusarium decemcellulare]